MSIIVHIAPKRVYNIDTNINSNWHEYGKLAFSANFLYLVLVTAAKKKPLNFDKN